MSIRVSIFYILFLSLNAHGKTVCNRIACVDDAGQVTFDGGFKGDMSALGAEVQNGKVGSGGSIGGDNDDGNGGGDNNGNGNGNGDGNGNGNGNGNGDQANNENQNGDQGGGQAPGGGGGAPGGGAGLADTGSSNLTSDDNDFGQYDTVANDEDDGKSRKPLETSEALGKAINEQGARDASSDSSESNNRNNSGGGSSGNSQVAAYNGGAGGGSYGSGQTASSGQAYGGSGESQDNGIVNQAKKFFKGAFGIGGGKSGRRGKSSKNEARKRRLAKLAARKTMSPDQVIKDKWRRMRKAGLVGRRGVASTAPRGMLDVRVNIFHGMCKEYSAFASEIGSQDAGYCPPAK